MRYLEQGTSNQLADPKDGTGKYGEVISESAIDIEGYEAVDPTSQTLNIRIETNKDDEGKLVPTLNVITFYYKHAITDLTISKSYGENGPYDPNQSAVFTVTGGDLGTGLKVVLNAGNGFKVTIKGLNVGTEYTVTEDNNWTWRYGQQNSTSITLQADAAKNTVTFTNSLQNRKWLTGGAWCDNNWAKGSFNKSTSTDYSKSR